MGNQREIIQREPSENRGVILRVLPGQSHSVRELLHGLDDPPGFYTHFISAGDALTFPNLDGPDTVAGKAEVDTLVIQSGGKMWCGYERFIELVRRVAASVEDALFYVGDEEDYIDEFRIRSRCLHYARVHQGCWRSLDDFFKSRAPSSGGR